MKHSPIPTQDPVGDDNLSDFTSAPVLVSLILGAVLLVLLVICRAYILFRRRKTRPANGNEAESNQAGNANGPPLYPDAPPSYDNVQSYPGLTSEHEVPGVYLNEAMEDNEPPPPKYYEIIKETPALTTITDSSK